MMFYSQFASFFRDGGPFMFVILGVAVLILGTALERFWVIGRASSWNARKLVRDLTEHVRRGDARAAAQLASRVKSPPGQVAHAILTSGAQSDESLYAAADGEAAISMMPLSRRLPYLSLLANTATLLGLLGTIFGLTTAFAAVGAADPSQRSAFLAAGISQALNTTAFGLIVAVPGMLIHGFLASRVERIGAQVDEITVRLIRAVLGRTPETIPSVAEETVALMPSATSATHAPGRPAPNPLLAAASARPDGTRTQPRAHR
jgi:biopolymer transport protein ExbB